MKIRRSKVKDMIELSKICMQCAKEKSGFLILRGKNGKMIKNIRYWRIGND